MATPAPASRLNVLARYQVACERSGHGRHTPDDHHDQRFEHINTVADWYDANGRVAASAVYRRGQAEPIHRNERGTTGRWREPARTREVLTEERTRMWTAEETQAFLDLHRSLAERMEPRWRIALSNARTAAEPFLASEPIELAIESAPWPAAPDTAGASPVLPGRSAAPTIGSLGLGL